MAKKLSTKKKKAAIKTSHLRAVSSVKAGKPIEQYEHKDKKRLNNPPVGLVDAHTDNGGQKKKKYAYDPHIDPQLQWAGKAEHTSFEVPTISLHVHERIDPRRIIETVKKEEEVSPQISLFEEQKKPLREAVEFYKHKENWSNRLIAGDSLLVMNSLLEKEAMGGKVQMVYFDPPYGIKYKSNFQAFINKRDVADGDKDEDLTAEPEMLKAFRDTWELGVHSYLTYIRDRILLTKDLLSNSGSMFIQISDENMHYIKTIMDEVFGRENKIATIVWKKGSPVSSKMRNSFNYLLWYSKNKDEVKSHKIYEERIGDEGTTEDPKKLALWGEFTDRTLRTLTTDEKRNIRGLPKGTKVFRSDKLFYRGDERSFKIKFRGKTFSPNEGFHWRGDEIQMDRLLKSNRLIETPDGLAYKFYVSDYPIIEVTNWWDDTSGKVPDMIYAVQTHHKIIERTLLLSTDPGDIVLDITCGSGTTAVSAEKYGRRWISCDTSRVAITLAKQRLMTANYDYYKLNFPNEGIGSGFDYEKAPHITLKTIGNCEKIEAISISFQKKYFDFLNKNGIDSKDKFIWEYQYQLTDFKKYLDTESMNSLLNLIDEYFNKISEVNQENSDKEVLYDKPLIDLDKLRVSGPFTVEAVPAPVVKAVEEIENNSSETDNSISRSGETLRQSEWKDELLRTGVRAKGGKTIEFTRVETLSGTRYLQAEAETKVVTANKNLFEKEPPTLMQQPQRVVVCFGPEHAPLEQRTVELALEEAAHMKPKPQIVLFCAFQFDEEASKDIDETNFPGVTLLKAQMNADLLTDDLKKNRSSNESFWLIGQPDVTMKEIKTGDDKGKYVVEVNGFDYYNPKTGTVESGNKGDIAMWMLDNNYDGRSLFPSQVFFPMAGAKEGWATLSRNLKAEIDEEKIQAFYGTTSLPFTAGKAVAVKIIDARGIESLKIIRE